MNGKSPNLQVKPRIFSPELSIISKPHYFFNVAINQLEYECIFEQWFSLHLKRLALTIAMTHSTEQCAE